MAELGAGAGDDEGERLWEERYSSHQRVWSGRPNAVLVDVVGSLPAGGALDLGWDTVIDVRRGTR